MICVIFMIYFMSFYYFFMIFLWIGSGKQRPRLQTWGSSEALGSRLEALESRTWGLRLQAWGSRISDLAAKKWKPRKETSLRIGHTFWTDDAPCPAQSWTPEQNSELFFFRNMMAFGFYRFYIKQNFLPQAFGPRTITGQILA